jgi:DNA ligase-1
MLNNQMQVYEGTKVSADWILNLASSNSRLHKKKVIEKALMAAKLGSTSAQCFLYNCYQAYNPFFVFNVKQVLDTQGLTGRPNPWPAFWALCEALRTRSVTGNQARLVIQKISEEFDSDEWNLVAKPVLLKDLRVGISDKTLNSVLAKTPWAIPVFGCQLATDSGKIQLGQMQDVRLETKLDGVRVLAIINKYDVDVQLLSRSGRVFNNFPAVEQAIKAHAELFISQAIPFSLRGSFVVDGEIVGDSFQQLMTQVHRKKSAKTKNMTYYIFDVLPMDAFMAGQWNISQQQRSQFLNNMAEKLGSNEVIKIMPGLDVNLSTSQGLEILHRFFQDAVDQGHEGIMIKDLSTPYRCVRSTNWLKWKPTITVDLSVVDLEIGTGRNANRLGALVCEGIDDGRKITVNVGSGFSDSDRREFWENRNLLIGQIVEICADAITKNQDNTYSLRFPRFLRFRGMKPGEKF